MTHFWDSVPIFSSEGTEFWVRKDFLKWCPKPHEYSNYDLINRYGLRAYLHRKDGYAIPSSRAYYIEGEQASEEQIYTVQYEKKLIKIIEE